MTSAIKRTAASKTFPIEEIKLAIECQARETLSQDAIDEYAASAADLPEIDVFAVHGIPYVVDGFHRLAAHRVAGTSFVRCRIVGFGTLEEASWHAVAANKSHGLRRSNADKRKAVRMALAAHAEMSDRAIAEHVGVSDPFVATVRRELQTVSSSTSKQGPAPKRLGRDGKERPATQPKAKAEPKPVPAPTKPEPPPAPATREPMPPTGPMLTECADVLRRARLEIKAKLPEPLHSKYLPEIETAEKHLRFDIPVVCGTCNGVGFECRPCQRKGWILASQTGRVPR